MNQTKQKIAPLTVTQLNNAIKLKLEPAFPSVWVTGEATGVKRHGSGHVYFSLKDQFSIIPAVMWRTSVIRLKFDIKDGMEVIVQGRVNVYPPHGRYQIEIERLEPKGVGAQELALRQLKEKLLTKGYFDPRRKKQLVAYPKRIALITSPSGAAVRDMLQVLTTRWPHCDVFVCPVRVQGDGACHEIAAAVRLLNRLHHVGSLSFDVLLLGRGGGSAEDLWAFNEEVVADAIFASRIPIISAVGHEIDVTIADLVADARALTPTDAANKATPDRLELLNTLSKLRRRLEDASQRRLVLARQRLDSLATRQAFRLPLSRIRECERRLDDLAVRLRRAVERKTERAATALAAVVGKLESLSPLNVLSRGYTLTRAEGSSELLRDAAQVKPGERLRTTVASGEIVSRVEEVHVAAQSSKPKKSTDFADFTD